MRIDTLDGPARFLVDSPRRAFGPFVLGRKVLGHEGFAVVRDGFRALIEEFGTGDGETRVPSEYLLTVAHRPGD